MLISIPAADRGDSEVIARRFTARRPPVWSGLSGGRRKSVNLIILLPLLITFIVSLNTMNLAAAELAPHLYKTTLDNGLTVLVKETPGTKVATVQIWVKAGSVYEDANEGGITHLIEHMIFKGTPTRKAGEVAGAIEEVGGQINAYTSYEYTVYHATLSARHWGLALDVLADAVLNSTFDPEELEREKKVVLEEISMREDQPRVRIFQELMTKSYQVHPYRLPVIGTRESVSSFTREDILNYVEKHYHPENFTVVIVGDVQEREVEPLVETLLGKVPKGNLLLPTISQEPAREKPDFFKISGDIRQTQLAISFPIAPFTSPDAPVLDIISGLLGQGETSRLYNRLRNREGLVYQINASAFTPRDPGIFEVFATLDSGKVEAAMTSALEEIFKLKYFPVEQTELARIKRYTESDFVFGLERVEGQARILGSFEFQAGDPREDEYLARIRSVTAEDILRVATTYFGPRKLVAGVIAPEQEEVALNLAEVTEIAKRADNSARNGVTGPTVTDSYLPNVYQYQLANGIRLVVREDDRVQTVAIRAMFPGGLRSETEGTNGAFAFISELLPKGTTDLTSRQLAIKVADMAGDLGGYNGKNTFGVKADFLSRFFEPGLKLVHDVILKPAFSKEEAEKIRPELLSQLKHQEDSLPTLAFLNLNKALFPGHPYGLNTAGSEEAIRGFTVEQLRDLYHEHIGPDKMVLSVAGSVKAAEVREMVEKVFGDWHAAAEKPESPLALVEETILPPDRPGRPDLIRINKDKEQLHIVIGFLATTMTSPDRYALEILDAVLSGQSGRLFVTLRDQQSLAYSLSSFAQFGLDAGSFGIYIGTAPEKKDQAIKAVWKELFRVRQEPISEDELTKARNQIIGHYELNLQTHGAQAMEMGLNETYKLGQDFGKRYIRAIQEVTAEEVLEAARQYILPNHYVMVTIGATDVEQIEPAAPVAEDTAEGEAHTRSEENPALASEPQPEPEIVIMPAEPEETTLETK